MIEGISFCEKAAVITVGSIEATDLMKKYLKEKNQSLIWFEIGSKYGAFGGLFDYSLKKAKGDCEKAVRSINEELKGKKIYLRLGLARPYGNIPEPYRGWCALQVNGFHTIPDLYEGDYNNWIRLE